MGYESSCPARARGLNWRLPRCTVFAPGSGLESRTTVQEERDDEEMDHVCRTRPAAVTGFRPSRLVDYAADLRHIRQRQRPHLRCTQRLGGYGYVQLGG